MPFVIHSINTKLFILENKHTCWNNRFNTALVSPFAGCSDFRNDVSPFFAAAKNSFDGANFLEDWEELEFFELLDWEISPPFLCIVDLKDLLKKPF